MQKIKFLLSLPLLVGILASILVVLVGLSYQYYVNSRDNIYIALAGPLTGTSASNGKSYRQGIQLYLDQINRKGGIRGRTVILDEYDDQNDCDKLAVQKAQEIVSNNRALAVIGHNYSDCSIKAGEIYQQHNIPAVTPSSTDVHVTAQHPWYFRTIFNDKSQGRFLAHYIRQVLQQETVSIIYKNNSYGLSLTEIFEKTAKELGIEIKYKWSFEPEKITLASRLDEIIGELATKPDAGLVFLVTHAPEGAKLVQLIKDKKIPNKIIAPDSFGTLSFQDYFRNLPKERMMPGFYTDGIYMTVPIIFDSANEIAHAFRNAYRTQYREEPDWHAAYAYDSILVLVKAISESKVVGEIATLEADRYKIKEYLSQQMNSVERAIIGTTGANYFDQGDPPFKPISVGVFRGGKIISAPIQLQNIHQLTAVTDLDTIVKEGKVILLDGSPAGKVNVVYTGIDIKEISELNSENLTYKLDFLLWFRYSGNFAPQAVHFINAIEPIKLGDPIDITMDTNGVYQLYHVVGRFKTELSPNYYLFNQHILSMGLRHNSLTRDQLIYVPDILGMQEEKNLARKLKKSQVLNLSSGWLLNSIQFLQTTIPESTLGKPGYLNANNGSVEYSSFVTNIVVQKNEFSFRTLIDVDIAKKIDIAEKTLVIGFIILLLLNLLNRTSHFSFPKIILLLQAIVIYILLLSSESVIIHQIVDDTSVHYLVTITVITATFRILWWVVSAILLHIAIERFLWTPLEKSTGRKIPNIIRGFLAFVIYMLASFGIIAFVFNQALTSLLATSGIIVMIIGLAIQINISNIFSGIALNIENAFRVGDWVKIGETAEAKVINITWRTTRVQLRNNAVLSIPNSTVAESRIVNYSYPEMLQEITIQINIDPKHVPHLVEKILIDAALSCKNILNSPAPYVLFAGVNEWAANYKLIVSSNNYAKASVISEEVWRRVWVHLNRAGIEFAIKQQKIHTFRGIAERGEEATKSITLLHEIEIFNPFSEEDKQLLSQQMGLQRFVPEEVIVRQGEQGDSLFIIVEGTVRVQVRTNGGEETIEVARLGAGNFFGEMALLMGGERAATVTAITDTRVYEITKANLMPLLQKQPEVSMLISKILTHRQMVTQLQLGDQQPSEKEKQSIYDQFLYRIESFFGLNKRPSVRCAEDSDICRVPTPPRENNAIDLRSGENRNS